MTDPAITSTAVDPNATVINPGAAPVAPAPAVDPNTGALEANQPLTRAASALSDHESYLDAWANNPAGDAPTRTWVDPTQRTGADGEFLSAWNDSQVAAPNPNNLPAHMVQEVAPDPVAPPPPAPAPAPAPAAAPADPAPYFEHGGDAGAGSGGGW
jgi:hypothetical protein